MRSLKHLFTTWHKQPGSGHWWQLKVGRQEGRDAEMKGVARPFLLPILHQDGGGRRKGKGVVKGIFSAFPIWPSEGSSPTAKTTSLGSTTDLQIATKKMFLLPDNWQWHPNVPDVSVWISVWVPPTETARAPQQGRLRQGGREASARRGDVITDVWGWEEAAMGAPGRFAGLDGPGEKTIEKTVSRI